MHMTTSKNQPTGSGDESKPAARPSRAKPSTGSSGTTPTRRTSTPRAAAAKPAPKTPAAAAKTPAKRPATPAARTPRTRQPKSPSRLEREANPKGRSTPALGKGLSKLQRQIEAAERAQKAMKLRAMRAPWDTIMKQCGYSSRGAAYTAVKRELSRIPREAAKELRISELETLDVAQRALGVRIASGDLGAIDRMLRIMDARAKLTGLYEEPAETGVDEVKAVLAAWIGQTVKLVEADDAMEEGDDDDRDE